MPLAALTAVRYKHRIVCQKKVATLRPCSLKSLDKVCCTLNLTKPGAAHEVPALAIMTLDAQASPLSENTTRPNMPAAVTNVSTGADTRLERQLQHVLP